LKRWTSQDNSLRMVTRLCVWQPEVRLPAW